LIKKTVIDKLFKFRDNMGCQDAISYFSNLIYESLDKSKRCVGMCILKYSRSFCFNRTQLTPKKLKTILGYNALWLWFKSYLSNRSQSTKINSEISDPCTVKYCIPQETVLGPIFM